jgi:hypothetical protein
VTIYYHVLPDNATNKLRILDVIPRFIGYSPGGITINYNTPNIMHTSGLLITRQFFAVIITITELSSSGKLTDFLSGTDHLWNSP